MEINGNKNKEVVVESISDDFTPENNGNPLYQLSEWMCEFTGDYSDITHLILLINIFRNLGRFVRPAEGELSILKPRSNLYGIIVAPPEEFYKSWHINQEDELTERIHEMANQNLRSERESVDLKRVELEKMVPDGDLKKSLLNVDKGEDYGEDSVSCTFDGSSEGIVDLLVNKDEVHLKAPEFGLKLKLQNTQRYDTGLIEAINNYYYKMAVD